VNINDYFDAAFVPRCEGEAVRLLLEHHRTGPPSRLGVQAISGFSRLPTASFTQAQLECGDDTR